MSHTQACLYVPDSEKPLYEMDDELKIFESMIGKEHGIPLCYPEVIPGTGDITLGDVGYVRGGTFSRIFNVVHGIEHDINSRIGLPPGFATWSLRDQDIIEDIIPRNTELKSGFDDVRPDEGTYYR